MTCSGICERHKAKHIVGKSMHALGYRRKRAYSDIWTNMALMPP